jgi:hypothetical protein
MSDSDIIPMTEDLPESKNEAEFRRRFGDVDGAAYRKMMNEIEQRLAALALYRSKASFLMNSKSFSSARSRTGPAQGSCFALSDIWLFFSSAMI